MPYAFRFQDGIAIPVNRDYFPLGKVKGDRFEYIDYSLYKDIGIPAEAVQGLTEDHYLVHLFGDDCAPWDGNEEAHDLLKKLDEIATNYALLITDSGGNA